MILDVSNDDDITIEDSTVEHVVLAFTFGLKK
jgi:hypothetical protein